MPTHTRACSTLSLLPPTNAYRGEAVPPKKRVELPDHVREAVLDDIALSQQEAAAAEERLRIRVHLAVQQGLTTYEIAERLGIAQQSVSRWSKQGEEARSRRFGEGASRPGELLTNGG